LPHFLQIRRLGGEPEQTGLRVEDRRGDRLGDLVSDRGSELPYCCDSVRVRQRRLHLAVSLLTLSRFGFRRLALGQIDDKGNALAPAFFDSLDSDQHRNAAAVFPEVLLFEWFQAPGRFMLGRQLA
jgi:hypothetical protein